MVTRGQATIPDGSPLVLQELKLLSYLAMYYASYREFQGSPLWKLGGFATVASD